MKEVGRQWEYDKAHTKQIKLKLNLVTDKDILEKLDQTENVQGYIKSLVRSDIERSMDTMKNEMKFTVYKGSKRSELHLNDDGYLVYKNGRHYNDETYTDESHDLIKFMLLNDGWRIEE